MHGQQLPSLHWAPCGAHAPPSKHALVVPPLPPLPLVPLLPPVPALPLVPPVPPFPDVPPEPLPAVPAEPALPLVPELPPWSPLVNSPPQAVMPQSSSTRPLELTVIRLDARIFDRFLHDTCRTRERTNR
jgi:homeobox protein ESX1